MQQDHKVLPGFKELLVQPAELDLLDRPDFKGRLVRQDRREVLDRLALLARKAPAACKARLVQSVRLEPSVQLARQVQQVQECRRVAPLDRF